MSTPTSPEPPLNGEWAVVADGLSEVCPDAAEPPQRADGSLAAFAGGDVRPADVARLSDLDRAAAARFARDWPDLPEATRERIVRAMDELAEDRVELQFDRVLRLLLDDPSPVVRQLAIAALWEDERIDLVDRLRALLAEDPSPDVRAEAARALGRFTDLAAAGDLPTASGRALIEDLAERAENDDEPYVLRGRALESLGVFGREERVRRLIEDAYHSDDQGLQGSALYAMGQSLDRDWLPTLVEELASPDAELRFEAARACGAMGDESSVPELLACARDEDAEVRLAAIVALGQIGGRAAVRALRSLSETAEEADQDAIAAALEEALLAVDPFATQR